MEFCAQVLQATGMNQASTGGSALKFSHKTSVTKQPSIPNNFALSKSKQSDFMCLKTCGNSSPRPAAFDADTIDTIGIDNHCSKCISNVRSDFIGELIKEIKTICRYHGVETKMVYRGLLQSNLSILKLAASIFPQL
jgi:hypothetical protein